MPPKFVLGIVQFERRGSGPEKIHRLVVHPTARISVARTSVAANYRGASLLAGSCEILIRAKAVLGPDRFIVLSQANKGRLGVPSVSTGKCDFHGEPRPYRQISLILSSLRRILIGLTWITEARASGSGCDAALPRRFDRAQQTD